MKRTITLLITVALLLGLSQCKKNVETVSSIPSEGVYITLNVDGGEKVAVNPTGGGTYATVDWEDGDILYVGNNGAYCGYLTYDGSNFGGTIIPTSGDAGDYLHFYFMGNKGPVGSAPSSVNITDQTSKYPVISYGRSTTLYNSGTTSYSATLYNKCAIVKFPISGAGTAKNITLRGMNNTVTVNFAANNGATTGNPYTFSKTGYGEITLHAESATEKWAIVLPQDAVGANLYADGYETVTVSVPDIAANTYHDDDISAITLTAGEPSDLFSVAAGTKVRFSPGNLQYKPSDGSWKFAANQYDIIGAANANISPSYDGWLDWFGWGTGDNPIKGYDDLSYNSTFNDWGDYCGDPTGNGYNWRTLSKGEWQYLFYSRTNANDKKGSATVNDIHGIVLLPDNWTLPMGCSFTAGMKGWDNNEYDANAWTLMENNGAVFLPAAGCNLGVVTDVGGYGYYWSSTVYEEDSDYAWHANFYYGDVHMSRGYLRTDRLSVRLVR